MPNYLPEPYATKLREAKTAGAKTYEGRPCKKGHSGVRYTAKGNDCVECAREVYHSNKEHVRNRQAARYQRDRRPFLIASAKTRAKRKGLDFDIDLDDIEIPKICPVFGTPMKSPSLDRHNNHLGYIKGNVRVISHRANTIKGSATTEELEAVLAYMQS